MSTRADAPPKHVTHPDRARAAVLRRLDRRIKTSGELWLPCAPAFLDLYMKRFALLFSALGKKFTDEELARVRELVEPRLQRGWEYSPHCRLSVKWESEEPPSTGLDYTVEIHYSHVSEQYAWWAEHKTPPLFGAHPDGKVVDEARLLPAGAPALDVGAGTGRNSLPLARMGHPTHALEITEAFVKMMAEAAANESVPLHPILGDVLGDPPEVLHDHYGLVVLSEVSSHFRGPPDLRRFFERAAMWARPGGRVVMNAFLCVDGYDPDPLARELSQVVWSCMFTRRDVEEALIGLPLRLVSDEPAYAYEQERQETWPPTGWFEDWSRGFDLFGVRDGLPPMELRWLVLERV
jgi:2-polyprenyl-3-methyl-5-hydroxy-6-metoxy-1,4-benzoquinol methylase